MEAPASKLIIHINYQDKQIAMNSEDIIKMEEIKQKIMEEYNLSEDVMNNMTLLYTDSDGDINIILDNEELEQIIIEQKKENEFLTEIKLELIAINNENNIIIQEENINDFNKKEEKNENNENKIKELEIENKMLKSKINNYIQVIKDLRAHYEKTIAEILYDEKKRKEFMKNFEENTKYKEINLNGKIVIKNNIININKENIINERNPNKELKGKEIEKDKEDIKKEEQKDKLEQQKATNFVNNLGKLELVKGIIDNINIKNEDDKLKEIKKIIESSKTENKDDLLKIIKEIIIDNIQLDNKGEKLVLIKKYIESKKLEEEGKNKSLKNMEAKDNKIKDEDKKQIKEILYKLINNISPLDLQKESLLFDIPIKKCKVDKISNLFTEMKNSQFQCNLCKNICKENIFNCIFCESFYSCETCHKNLNKKNNYDHEHEKEYFIEISFPTILKSIINYNSTLEEFNKIIVETFFDENENFNNKNIEEFDYKSKKTIIKNFLSLYKNGLTYIKTYEKLYLESKFKSLSEEEKKIITEKIASFNNKMFGLAGIKII